jgi:hypothetical protein
MVNMKTISFPNATRPKERSVGTYLRLRPWASECLKAVSIKKRMAQRDLVETCLALYCKEAQPGMEFKLTLLKKSPTVPTACVEK